MFLAAVTGKAGNHRQAFLIYFSFKVLFINLRGHPQHLAGNFFVFQRVISKIPGFLRIILSDVAVITPETQRPAEMVHDAIHLFFVSILGQYLKVLVCCFGWGGKGYGYYNNGN
jgi:hypothetical protein